MRSRARKPWWSKQRRPEPLTDLYASTWIRMWFALEEGSFEQVADDSVGDLPEWYDRDVTELGWNSILGKYGFGSGGWADDLNWLVAHGIAPEQPFLVHLDKPHWYKSGSYEYEEWDCDYDWEIVRVAPLARASIARRWEKAIESEQAWRAAKAERDEQLRFLTRTDTKAMFIWSQWYFAPGQSLYDDMEMPRALRYTLCSSASLEKNTHFWRGITAQLASGEDNDGHHERAMSNMVKDALAKLPGLSEEFIRKLPVQSGGW